MLLSATPLNNRPDDLQNQLLLFQNSQSCTIDGVPNLKGFFSEHILDYKRLMRERDQRDVTAEVDKIYEQIRSKVIDKVTVRRTRNNILNDPDYKADIKSQGIIFPNILPPNELEYLMDSDTSNRFYETLKQLTDGKTDENPEGKGLTYARYRAVEFLKPEYRSKYKNAVHIGQTLAAIYRVHMVKRLESSFYAFKKSLRTLLRITTDMIKMFDEDKVIIAPDLKVKDLQAKNMELDEIIEHLNHVGRDTKECTKRLLEGIETALQTLNHMDTIDMIKMFDEDKVIIAPDLKVKDLQAKNMELDEIIEYAITKGYAAEDILFSADAFSSEFLEMLHHDREILEQLNADWAKENDDPKFGKVLTKLIKLRVIILFCPISIELL